MIHDWMAILECGRYEEWLHNLTIIRPGEEALEGYGRLKWTLDGMVEVEAYSMIKDLISEVSFRFQPGIVPRSEHYTLGARTGDGWEVEIPNIVTSPNIHMTEGLSGWRFHSPTLSLTRRTGMQDRSLRALLGPLQRIAYPRSSKTTDDNPHFGGDRLRRDWMRLETSFGLVVARRSVADSAIVQIEADLDRTGLIQALYSVQTALSFVEGRNVRITGYESLCDGEHERTIARDVRTTKNTFVPPLGWMPDPRMSYEDLLTLAANFFHTERGSSFSDQLRMCWAMADSYGSQKAMAACGAVDKLVKLSNEGFALPVLEQEENARKAIKRYLSKRRDRLGERFTNRIISFLDKMKTPDTKDILRRWVAEKFLGLEQEDLKSWDALRHPVAHGELIFNFKEGEFAELEKTFGSLRRVENMVNKLVLFEMGYGGDYYDYSNNKHSTLNYETN